MLESVLTLWPHRILGAPLIPINVSGWISCNSAICKRSQNISPDYLFFPFGPITTRVTTHSNECLFLKSLISWKMLVIFSQKKFLDCNVGDISLDISLGGPPSVIGVLDSFTRATLRWNEPFLAPGFYFRPMLENVFTLWPPRILGAALIPINVSGWISGNSVILCHPNRQWVFEEKSVFSLLEYCILNFLKILNNNF